MRHLRRLERELESRWHPNCLAVGSLTDGDLRLDGGRKPIWRDGRRRAQHPKKEGVNGLLRDDPMGGHQVQGEFH